MRGSDAALFTRGEKPVSGFEEVRADLAKLFGMAGSPKGLFLDGELYAHGRLLQDIVGAVRRAEDSTNNSASKDDLRFFVFDVFVVSPEGEQTAGRLTASSSFADRWRFLTALFARAGQLRKTELVETRVARTAADVQAFFRQKVAEGFEGAVARDCAAAYEHRRSPAAQKIKTLFTAEFRVAGFTAATEGREKDAILWVCETAPAKGRPTSKKERFTVAPKQMSLADRRALFTAAKRNFKPFRGRPMTVEYQALSDAGVPLRAKALWFRELL